MEAQDYLVTVQYDPGTPVTYLVTSAPSQDEAQLAALRCIRYHPGVPIRAQLLTTALRQHRHAGTLGKVRWDSVVEYSPLTTEEREQVRYND